MVELRFSQKINSFNEQDLIRQLSKNSSIYSYLASILFVVEVRKIEKYIKRTEVLHNFLKLMAKMSK